MAFIEIFGTIFGISAIVGSILIFLLLVKKSGKTKINLDHEPAIIDSFIPEFTKGYTCFLENDAQPKPNGKVVIKGIPIDYSVSDRENKEDIEEIPIIARDNLLITFPAGTWSKRVTRKWVLPRDINKLPKCMEKSPEFSLALKQIIIFKNMENDFFKMIKDKEIVQADLMRETKGGEMSRQYFKQFEDNIIKALTKSLQKATEQQSNKPGGN